MLTEQRDRYIENGMLVGTAAVSAAGYAGRRGKSFAEKAAVHSAEQRLRQLNMVKGRLEDSRREYNELKEKGIAALRQHDASMVSLISPGMRLSPEEVHEVQLSMLRQRISADRYELKKMNSALRALEADPFFGILKQYYEQNMSDADIADALGYDRSTIARHRRRLIGLIAFRLYGSSAAYGAGQRQWS